MQLINVANELAKFEWEILSSIKPVYRTRIADAISGCLFRRTCKRKYYFLFSLPTFSWPNRRYHLTPQIPILLNDQRSYNRLDNLFQGYPNFAHIQSLLLFSEMPPIHAAGFVIQCFIPIWQTRHFKMVCLVLWSITWESHLFNIWGWYILYWKTLNPVSGITKPNR